MIILKLLGTLDLIAAAIFLTMIFGFSPPFQLLLFCGGLLLAKGMFVFTGDPLSIQDIFYSICMLLSMFFALPSFILWLCAFLLIAKGVVSWL
jgi:hypothetical protein